MALIDLHAVVSDQQFESDLLIVGAGIAGLVLADALRGSGRMYARGGLGGGGAPSGTARAAVDPAATATVVVDLQQKEQNDY